MAALRELRPGSRFFGLGGDEMSAEGLDAVAHSREISVVGFTEVLRVLPRARQIFHRLLAAVESQRPEVAVLIDSPGFNLRLAKALWQRGIPVIYYISPQVWAWHRSRVKNISRWVRLMLVLFPFEASFYEEHGVSVIHVGHPIVDEVPTLPQAWDRGGAERRVALLPGSRDSEVRALLPLMLESARLLAEEQDIRVRLIQAPTVSPELIQELCGKAPLTVETVRGGRFEAVADAHLALCASGTATLEVGLLGTPMVVIYRVGRWTAMLGRRLVRVPHISLVNLVLEERVVPELMQEEATTDSIVAVSRSLLAGGPAVVEMRRQLGGLRTRLGRAGASRRAAEAVASFMDQLGESTGRAECGA